MSLINSLFLEISSSVIRQLTGQLFTDTQLKSITTHAIGRYFSDWLPKPEEDKRARERVEEAREHIEKASSIISSMQSDLNSQTAQLDKLLIEIEEKKMLAERYEELAETSQEKFTAFRQEMEKALRKEIIAQSEQGKRVRQTASLIVWIFTLVLGAALGTYFKDVVSWGKTFLN
ncbi:MAG: hypothetical protein ACD_5C00224G0002 [uncultured bacterium]|nr:MAG: hypothetical protein ACD_5C00224G0002 [uncultured bacterium]